MEKWGRYFDFYSNFLSMITNKADYVLGICNYILLDGAWDKKEPDIPSQSNSVGSWLCLEGYGRLYVGGPLCSNQMESKNNVWYLLVRLFYLRRCSIYLAHLFFRSPCAFKFVWIGGSSVLT